MLHIYSDRSIRMSSASDFIASLTLALTNIYEFGGPILMIIGTVSNILSLIVFTKKNLRKNPCAIYFTAVNLNNLLLIYTSILFLTLSEGYDIDPGSYNLIFCRFQFYTMFLFDVLTPSYLILASFDRMLITSPNALTRRRSTRRLAYICVIIATLFWVICHCHALIFTDLVQFAPGDISCYFQPGVYTTVITYYSLIIKSISVPVLMVITGLWTVKNVRGVARITPAPALTNTGTGVNGGLRSVHSKDRQLIKILLVDTSIYIIFNTMITVILIYQEATQNQPQTSVETAMQNFLFEVSVFSTYIPFCIGCYTNLLVSKTFRNEVKNVLMCKSLFDLN